VPIAAVRAGRLGGYSSSDALLELLRQWHAAEPDERRRFRAFRAWVLKSSEGSDASTLAARAISKRTFVRRFGSWVAALAQAGLLDGVSFVVKRLVSTPRKYAGRVPGSNAARLAGGTARRTVASRATRCRRGGRASLGGGRSASPKACCRGPPALKARRRGRRLLLHFSVQRHLRQLQGGQQLAAGAFGEPCAPIGRLTR
jgi:hypothetical protein